ncbi:VOC family protein [Nocardioides alcanivorans]|uniref:VOC family protein n=1 Tax=Nocardioides alcanivorans TaxID=2897352 RepID=UPI001F43DD80|nr:VOC family protein [Nocardioides alcanivorans]
MTSITPNLWFNHEAAEAATFYTEIFGGKVLSTFGEGPVDPQGKQQPITVEFEIVGMRFVGINGGLDEHGKPIFTPNEAVSLEIDFDDQAELERVWHALIADTGEPSYCGWLKDRYGFSWQLVPANLVALIDGPDAEGAARAMKMMMETKFVPLDGPALQAAYDGSA